MNIQHLKFAIAFLFALFQCRASAGTFTEIHEINCQQTLIISRLGYPTWSSAIILKSPSNGAATIKSAWASFDTLIYQPKSGFAGVDTIIVLCAKATQITCDTGIYVVKVSCLNATGDWVFHRQSVHLKLFESGKSIVIQSDETLQSVVIYTMDGRKVRLLNPLGAEIPIDDLPPGYYAVTVRLDRNRRFTQVFHKS